MLTTTTKPNRLAREKSPYLQQHQFNPVDWYAWGEEAFEKARREDKPIFLSIGYSTCHWCHVMERESFENDGIAEYLNEHFVSIKVDREERPDLDRIYMTAVQALTGQGGWPLSCFLTPDLKPFFGGTYFPPEARYGRVGFPQLLEQIHQIWVTRHGDILSSASDLHDKLNDYTTESPGDFILHPRLLHAAAEQFKRDYDPQNGGFGTAPKFPHPVQPLFLLRYGVRFEDQESIDMVLYTCEHMAKGGMFDQLGGGFHRYSVDERWLVPHFEKMLYDQAQLVHLYLDAWLVSGKEPFAETARQVIDYVLQDMTDAQGGFYSAEDADSEGKEGKFYCWTLAELTDLLTPAELRIAVRQFGITKDGNFIDHSDPDALPWQNVLSIVDEITAADDRIALASAEHKMLEARARRVRPLRDDKVLATWNGMMLGAISRAATIFGNPAYRAAADKNFTFIRTVLWDSNKRLLHHRWREGELDTVHLLDDYAHVLSGVLDYYESTLTPDALAFAVELAESAHANFFDSDNGGFFQTSTDDTNVILRIKEFYDGAEPSANSVIVVSLLRLAAITGRTDFRNAAEITLRLFSSKLHSAPQIAPNLLIGLDMLLDEPSRVAVVGPRDHASRLLHAIHSVYQPNKVITGTEGPVDPFTKSLPTTATPTVYLCTGTACQPPTTDPAKIKQMLQT